MWGEDHNLSVIVVSDDLNLALQLPIPEETGVFEKSTKLKYL